MIRAVDRVLSALEITMIVVLTLAGLAMAFVQVILRYVFNTGVHWLEAGLVASEISSADIRRDAEHQNTLVTMEASLSNLSVKLKVEVAHRRRMEAQNRKFRDMLFGPSSEKTDKDDGKSDDPEGDAEIPKPDKPKPKAGGAAAAPPEAPKKRGMLGRQKVEIPAHLPREPRIIEPESGATCGCGFELRKVGEQIIRRLSYEPAKVYVIEEYYPKYACRCCGKFVQASSAQATIRAVGSLRILVPLFPGIHVAEDTKLTLSNRTEPISKPQIGHW